ncbi:MAG: hypothetical protein LKK19_05380 [Bacteroidales bacterium]|jgi:hypothetical protein|nr:hypothetical protein [Bacteroidales bacterium]MCI2122116.1 hypothetical protein [Bacteroidales bacterium]MCI2145627.1 hypothetical protein [Bacteroidales bacterium]
MKKDRQLDAFFKSQSMHIEGAEFERHLSERLDSIDSTRTALAREHRSYYERLYRIVAGRSRNIFRRSVVVLACSMAGILIFVFAGGLSFWSSLIP